MKLTTSELRELYEEARKQLPDTNPNLPSILSIVDYSKWMDAHDFWFALEKNDEDSDWGWSKWDYVRPEEFVE